MSDGMSIALAPLLPWPALAALVVIGLGLVAAGAVRGRRRGAVARGTALLMLGLALLDPQGRVERREARDDVALIVRDRSASQRLDGRDEQAYAAWHLVTEALAGRPGLEVRDVDVAGTDATRLFDALDAALRSVPDGRFAGAVVITDGQVHDAPPPSRPGAAPGPLPGPLHVLLTGRRDEVDRRLVVTLPPRWGLVGSTVDIAFRVIDSPTGAGGRAVPVRVRLDGRESAVVNAPVGRDAHVGFTLDHGGPTSVELIADPLPGEVSGLNNRAVVTVEGVRDRLRVLLISGRPHQGERVWRNLLKADPAVDLVHFTILRPPEKTDFTPMDELALIVFPARELFEEKLSGFDLIILDRYQRRHVLLPAYWEKVAGWVRDGGGLLAMVGPEFVGDDSLWTTALRDVLPAAPTGRTIEQAFRPALTAAGRRHPVTSLADPEAWGHWFRAIDVVPRGGPVLMQGPGPAPLLVLDRVGSGRVALLASDQMWLWARDYDGGGPAAELSRRLVHWLMKEPDLEEEALSARVDGDRLIIHRRSLDPDDRPVTVTAPDGTAATMSLRDGRGVVPADTPGPWRIDDGARSAVVVAGRPDAPETADPRATAAVLAPVVAASGGGVAWIADGVPAFRDVAPAWAPARAMAGRGWMGLVRHHATEVTGSREARLLPGLVLMAAVLALLALAWGREGR